MVFRTQDRRFRGGVAGVALAATLSIAPSTAAADPAPPNPAGPVEQARALSRQAEVITEQWKLASDRLLARQAEAGRAHRDASTAKATADQARSAQSEFRAQVDRLTSATFEGVRLSSFTAMLISDSPRQFVDQMAALDVLAVSNRTALDKLAAAVARTEQAETQATDAETRAAVAELDAARIAEDVAKSRIEMGRQ
ncbi:MAG TPA: glycoside hydrolase, partial [Pseudonocardiaceae bacterium]|nr:glycoside hydrolase [Pseudonocardiaceae bacterium]